MERKLISVTIEMTRKCNHLCKFCYIPDTHDRPSLMPPSKKQLDLILGHLQACGVERVTITGGEPFLYKSELYYLIDRLNELEIEPCLNTNLTILDEEDGKHLRQVLGTNNMIFSSIPSVCEDTCDQITQVSGSYKRILTGLDILKRNGIPVGLNMSVSNENSKDLYAIIPFLEKTQVDCFTLFRVIPPVCDRNNPEFYTSETDIIQIADKLLEIHTRLGIIVGSVRPLPRCVLGFDQKYDVIRSNACSTGRTRCSVNVVTGNVEACSQQEHSYGNIYRESLSGIFDRMRDWDSLDFTHPKCKECKDFNICGGECLWEASCVKC